MTITPASTGTDHALRVTFRQDDDDLGWVEMHVVWPAAADAVEPGPAASRTSVALISYVF